MRLRNNLEPPLGSVEIYYPHGVRSMRVPVGTDMNAVLMQAHEMWDEYGEELRVRVIRYLEDGTPMGICHLPPSVKARRP